jgi:hypothetical protein
VPAIVTIRFSGGKIRARGEDGAYEVRNLLVYNTVDPDLGSDVEAPHTTASLTASTFHDAPLVAGAVLLGPAMPLADATVYLDPLEDQTTTDAQGHYGLALAGPGGVPISVRLLSVPGYPDDSWRIRVDGTVVGFGTSVVVTPEAGATVAVNFETGDPVGVETQPATGSRLRFSAPRPNPVTGGRSVALDYSAPAGARLRALVLDVRGRAVRNLLDRTASGLDGVIAWDGRDDRGRPVAQGTYVIRLVATWAGHEETASRKVVWVD